MKGQSRIVVYSLSHVQLFVTPRTAACQDSIFFNSSWNLLKLMPFWRILEETIALTRQTFADKVMSLLFNMQSRFVIVFLPRSKGLLISWLQSPSEVILEPKKIKPVTVLFPQLFAMKWWDGMPWYWFFECRVLFTLLFNLQEPF